MGKQIKIQIRTVYGNETVYPACPAAVLFARIAGTKTLTAGTLQLIRSLGYEITVDHPRISIAA